VRAGKDNIYIWLTITFIAVIYFSIPCYSFFSDGIQFAIQFAFSSSWTLHPHHILYPLLPQVFYSLSGGPDSGTGALDFLAQWSQITGLLSCVVFALILSRSSFKTPSVITGLLLFAFSNGVWYFSVTPNQNSTALLFHLTTLYALVHYGSIGKPLSFKQILIISVLVCLAILSSQVNASLVIPALWLIHEKRAANQKNWPSSVLFIFLTVFLLVFIVGIIGFFVGGFRHIMEFVSWQNSYVYQSRWWPDSPADGFSRNVVGLFTVYIAEAFSPGGLVSNWFSDFGSATWFRAFPVRIGQAFSVIFILFELYHAINFCRGQNKRNPVQTIGILAALPVLIFSIFFIPENINFRLLYIPGFLLFLIPSIEQRYMLNKFRIGKAWPLLLVVAALFLVNLASLYIPASNPVSNPRLVEVGELTEYVSPDDMIIYPWSDEGHTQSLYAQYFLACNAFTVNKLMEIESEFEESTFPAFLTSVGGNFWIHEDLVDGDESSESIASLYNNDLTQSEIAGFVQRWFRPTGDEIQTKSNRYLRFEVTPDVENPWIIEDPD